MNTKITTIINILKERCQQIHFINGNSVAAFLGLGAAAVFVWTEFIFNILKEHPWIAVTITMLAVWPVIWLSYLKLSKIGFYSGMINTISSLIQLLEIWSIHPRKLSSSHEAILDEIINESYKINLKCGKYDDPEHAAYVLFLKKKISEFCRK